MTSTTGDLGTAPTFDLWRTSPQVAEVRDAALRADWASLAELLDGAGSADVEAAMMGAVAEVPDVEHWLEAVVAESGNTTARALLADRYVHLAWEARTAARAVNVSAAQLERFHGWLRRAELELIEVCAREPRSAHAWTVRLASARGLELGRSEARRRYDRLAEHHPHHLPAQTRMLLQLTPRWGGSLSLVGEFVDEVEAIAPAGSASAGIGVIGHVEHWVEIDGDGPARAYLGSDHVLEDLHRSAEMSVGHPAHVESPSSTDVRSALAFSVAGDLESAAPWFEALGDRPSLEGWRYTADPAAAYVARRRAALRKGAGR